MQTISPLAHAIISRLDKLTPSPEGELPAGSYGCATIALSVEAAGTVEDYVVSIDDVKVGAPTIAAPTAAALTLAGVARMLKAIDGAGAVAPHVRARALAALFDESAPADARTLEELQAVRDAARAHLPPVHRAAPVRIKAAPIAFRRV
jgi:hypothetical protein